jgi:hypothetical protein
MAVRRSRGVAATAVPAAGRPRGLVVRGGRLLAASLAERGPPPAFAGAR